MRIEVKYKEEDNIGYGVTDIHYSVAVDNQEPYRWKSHDPPVGGYGIRDYHDNVMDFITGLIVGKSGMRRDPEAFALAEEMLKRAKNHGRDVRYVTQERGDHED